MTQPSQTYGWDSNNVPIQVTANILAGNGVPSNGIGNNGDFYFRTDGTILVTCIYHKAAGVWVGLALA